ncbi:MAG: aldo/keto reductase [Acidobacteriota bacterium]
MPLLGETATTLPPLGIGTWRHQGGVQPIRRAVELGAAFVDTAESYGTEEVVGEAIRGIRDQVFLASKALPRNFRRRDLLAAAENSLRRLRTDHLDLYQLHWPNTTVPLDETMAAMEELVDSGKVRFIGVSNFSPRLLQRARNTCRRHPVVSNQVRYSLWERTIEHSGLLDHCRRVGVTVLAYSPLRHQSSWFLPGSGVHDAASVVIAEVARKYGKTPVQVALNWCLRHPHVVVLFQSNQVAHVEENCGAAGWQLEPEDVERLSRAVPYRVRSRPERWLRALARWVEQRMGRGV